jgi:transcription elongation factor GreA
MSKVNYYTPEGLKKLKDELNQLRDVERPKASQDIADARDKGDLSENAEENLASNARIIDESQLDTSKVLVHSSVKIKNQINGAMMTYKLVAQNEADIKKGLISVDSPIGRGLLGKEVGEVAEIQVPSGVMKFDIVSISRD